MNEANDTNHNDALVFIDGTPVDQEAGGDPTHMWEKIKHSQAFPPPPLQVQDGGVTMDMVPCTRLVCFSDTHGKHRQFRFPPGDFLIHAGDFTKSGEVKTMMDFYKHLQEQVGEKKFRKALVIAGNHDMTLDPDFYKQNWRRFHRNRRFDCGEALSIFHHSDSDDVVYLQDESVVLDHSSMYGSPWTPEFYNWAFNKYRGQDIDKVWKQIPDETDILVTHGPPLGRGDAIACSQRTGCSDLLRHVQERIRPRVHIFGHIHEAAGVSFDGQTVYVNASSVDLQYQAAQYPIVIDLPHDPSLPARIVQPNYNLIKPEDLPDWLERNDFARLAEKWDPSELGELTIREMLGDCGYQNIVGLLRLHRRPDLHPQLQLALSELYAQLFLGGPLLAAGDSAKPSSGTL